MEYTLHTGDYVNIYTSTTFLYTVFYGHTSKDIPPVTLCLENLLGNSGLQSVSFFLFF